jgi:predicted PilT family ATPase
MVPLLDESGLAWFAEEIKYRIDTGNDCPVILSGYPGMGKSTLAQKFSPLIVCRSFFVDDDGRR